jgi:GNAT superfamily N-acetyltransferase
VALWAAVRGGRAGSAGLKLTKSSSMPMKPGRAPQLALAPFATPWLEPCQALLEGLPEWFGSAAVAGYAADLSRFPTWVAHVPSASPSRIAIGCVSVTAPQPAAFEVHLLAVAREHHGRGVGSALLDIAERWALRCGARFLQVKTSGPSNPDPVFASTRAFYLARGFTPLFESDRLWGSNNPAWVLVKVL